MLKLIKFRRQCTAMFIFVLTSFVIHFYCTEREHTNPVDPDFNGIRIPKTRYTLNVAISPTNGGSVASSPNQNQYDPGTTVTLTASPASGYQFAQWQGDVTGTTNPTAVTMNGNKNVTAVFSEKLSFFEEALLGLWSRYHSYDGSTK